MKREELKALGLDNDAIDKVIDLHHTEISESKTALTKATEDLAKAQGELTTSQDTIKELQEIASKYDGVDLDKLKTDFATKEQEYVKQLEEQKTAFAMQNLFDSQVFASELAKKGAMDEFKKMGFKYENDTFLGAEDYFKGLKEKDPNAFKTEEDKKPPIVVKTGGSHGDDPSLIDNDKMRAVMGLAKEE